jgi:hypothetical protein
MDICVVCTVELGQKAKPEQLGQEWRCVDHSLESIVLVLVFLSSWHIRQN